jgi:hypothetical protein
VASIGIGSTLSTANKMLTSGIKTARTASNASKGYSAVKNSLQKANLGQRIREGLIPGISGSAEGITNALDTKQTTYNDGKSYVDNFFNNHQKEVKNYVDDYIMSNKEDINNLID